ncbi:hypothetical protein TD95_004206 [Thielaviopsis punctulata]|uniref:UDP-N-acetylglucosamine transferase subunit ALG13 n=1 Tax=Thielaviopsis punctulata TaxID=72032 RepID=A0A0F4ZKJ5_9PEZI|nr:hypothetical protein TD95_004206 [Thielaviopsis punctulata]
MPIPSLPSTFSRPPTTRHCFVTVGATVTFSALLSAIQHEAFLSALILSGFTHLTVQAGRDYDAFCAFAATVDERFLTVECFDLKDSLARDMALCRAEEREGRAMGVVISHAGTGSVLDAMTAQAPLIVVPNEALLDNHQVELAQMVESRKYGVRGTLT